MVCFDKNGNKKTNTYWFFLIVCFFLVYFTYGMSMDEHFALDTYAHLAGYTTEHIVQLHFGSGRYVAGFLVLLMESMGVKSGTHQYVGVIALMISTAFSAGTGCYLIYAKMKDRSDCAAVGIVFLSVLLIYINPFLTEWFLYPEADIIFAFALLFLTLSCVVTCRYHTVAGSLLATGLLYLGLCCYQAILPIYVIFVILSEICGSGCIWSKENIISVFRTVLIGLAATLLSVYLTRIINNNISMRMNERSPVFDIYLLLMNMWMIMNVQKPLWVSGMETMPVYSVATAAICLLILAVVALAGRKSDGLRVIPAVIFLVLFLIGIYIMVFSPMYFTAMLWFSHRIFPSFMMIYTCLGCIIATNKPGRFVKCLTALVLIVFLCMNVLSAQRYQRAAFAVNAEDRDALQYIVNKIEDYEEESGYTVEQIAYICDQETDEMSAFAIHGDACKPVRRVDWCFRYAISWMAGREFGSAEMNEEIMKKHFEDKNYDTIHEDQFVFEGNTLYMLIY